MLSDIRLVITGSTLWYESTDYLQGLITYITKEKPTKKELDFLSGLSLNADLGFIFSLYKKYYYAIVDFLHFEQKKPGYSY
jgi:hypothetical protein